jgi:hypothetical protein
MDLGASRTWQPIRRFGRMGRMRLLGNGPCSRIRINESGELYDLRHDPDAVIILANSPEHRSVLRARKSSERYHRIPRANG